MGHVECRCFHSENENHIGWSCLLIGFGFGIPIGWTIFDNQFMMTGTIGEYFDRWRISHQVFSEFRRLPLTIGHASSLMLLFRSRIVPWLIKAFANVGQMVFTNNLMQKYHLYMVLF